MFVVEFMGTFEIVPIVKCCVVLERVPVYDFLPKPNRIEQPSVARAMSDMRFQQKAKNNLVGHIRQTFGNMVVTQLCIETGSRQISQIHVISRNFQQFQVISQSVE